MSGRFNPSLMDNSNGFSGASRILKLRASPPEAVFQVLPEKPNTFGQKSGLGPPRDG